MSLLVLAGLGFRLTLVLQMVLEVLVLQVLQVVLALQVGLVLQVLQVLLLVQVVQAVLVVVELVLELASEHLPTLLPVRLVFCHGLLKGPGVEGTEHEGCCLPRHARARVCIDFFI